MGALSQKHEEHSTYHLTSPASMTQRWDATATFDASNP